MTSVTSKARVRVRITPDLIALLDQRRLQTAQRGRKRWKPGDVLALRPEARIEPYAHLLEGFTLPSALGAFSYCCAEPPSTMRIGRYSSIAAFVSQMGMGHPTDWVSSSPFSHNPQPLGGFESYLRDIEVSSFHVHPFKLTGAPIEVGNDVWIGEGALLKPGVRIGDGAIVAARAIVTHDVPPYAIVGGTPARLIRYRFPEALVEKISATQWWRFGPDIIQPLDVREPEAFAERFEQALADGAKPLDLPILTGQDIIAAGEVVE